MPREFARCKRVSEQIHRLLADLIRQEIKDPRLSMVSINEVDVSRDLSHAKVYFGMLNPDSDSAVVQAALIRANGFLRSQLARELGIRHVPELHFHYDDSAARGAELTSLISAAVSDDLQRRGEHEGEHDGDQDNDQ